MSGPLMYLSRTFYHKKCLASTKFRVIDGNKLPEDSLLSPYFMAKREALEILSEKKKNLYCSENRQYHSKDNQNH
jgi:hypothetical protein